MSRFFISAGDPSGDIHSARLIKKLKEKLPDSTFLGLGGNESKTQGLETLVPLEQISIVGFWEVAKKYFFFKKLLNQCKNILSSNTIDCFIAVDYPGFNIPLANFAKKKGIPVFYYIAPQLWAWGKSRAKKLSNSIDLLLNVFPFEISFFSQYSINCKFVGHPLIDDPAFRSFNTIEHREKRIAFLPGSRRQEVEKHLPIFADVSKLINNKYPDFEIGIAQSPFVNKAIYKDYINSCGWHLWNDSRRLMQTSIAGVIKTGTSNLEAALCGLPFVMVYKASPISYFLGKRLLDLPFVSLPNILLNKEIVKEFIQNSFTPTNIIAELGKIIEDHQYWHSIQASFLEIRYMLGNGSASENASVEIIKALNDPL